MHGPEHKMKKIYLIPIPVSLVLVILYAHLHKKEVGEIFLNLQTLTAYAQSMQEYPPNDSVAWAAPSFASFWRKQTYTWRDRLAQTLGFQKKPLWHAQGFERLLEKTTALYEDNGYIGRFVVKMKPVPGSVFVLWGDVQGAFHSMVRVLNYLHEKEIINDRFEIVKPYTYFVFNGDLINRGAYSLEVLTVVMHLMQRNLGKVFYIRGRNEDAGHWKNFNLKNELMIRIGAHSSSDVPLGQALDQFFNTLPLALYLIDTYDQNAVDLVRISSYNRKFTELNEDNFATFLAGTTTDVPVLFKLNQKATDPKIKINVRAIIEGEDRASVYRPSQGLAQLEADKGATAWTLLSSPTESYRYLQDFYFDAFVLLDIGKKLSDWTLRLYSQDVRELLGITQIGIYNLVNGLRDYQREKAELETDPFGLLFRESLKTEKKIADVAATCLVDEKK